MDAVKMLLSLSFAEKSLFSAVSSFVRLRLEKENQGRFLMEGSKMFKSFLNQPESK